MSNHHNTFHALLFSLLSGLIFGMGLILAGMANPAKVLAFLDLAGWWDPSLGLVMGGAIAVGAVAFAVAKKRPHSYLGFATQLPASRVIDKRLVFGSLVFGTGWGLVGICPAPAFVIAGSGSDQGLIFIIFMMLGMVIFEVLENYQKPKNTPAKS